MSKCEICSHQYACAAWIRHCETIYDDFVYSTDNCPYYINTMENFVSKTVYSIVNLYDYDGNTDTEVLGVFETLDEAKEQLRVQYSSAMISILADYAGIVVDPEINDEELDNLAKEHLYCNWCTAVQAVVSSADNYTDEFVIRESTFHRKAINMNQEVDGDG